MVISEVTTSMAKPSAITGPHRVRCTVPVPAIAFAPIGATPGKPAASSGSSPLAVISDPPHLWCRAIAGALSTGDTAER